MMIIVKLSMDHDNFIIKLKLHRNLWKPINMIDYHQACCHTYRFNLSYSIHIDKKFKKYKNSPNVTCIHVWSLDNLKVNKAYNAINDMHNLVIAPNNCNVSNYIDNNLNFNFKKYLDTNLEFNDLNFNIFNNDFYNKGLISRVIFYIITIYYDKLLINNKWFMTNLHKLKKWNMLYPPNKFELLRNYKIKCIQGNVNPYVINYTLVNKIFY